MSRSKQARLTPRRRPSVPLRPQPAPKKRPALPRWAMWAAYSIALVMLVGLGLIHGALTDRWGPSVELVDLGKRLHDLPTEIAGRWFATEQQLEASVERQAEIDGYVFRRYDDRSSRAAVQLLAVVGRQGPVATHTPEDCFPGAGMEQRGESRVVDVTYERDSSGHSAEFWTADFQGSGADAPHTRVFWSWNAGKGWEAPANARTHFAGTKALYKLYVVADTSAAEPMQHFVEAVMAHVDATLFEKANQ